MRNLVVELTNRCQLRCRHCFVTSRGEPHDLDLDTLQRFLNGAHAAGFRHVSFTGGECTLHADFSRALQLSVQAGYRVGFVSNGCNFAQVLPQLEPFRHNLSTLTFSLDGSDAITHDRLRGSGSFVQVLRAVSICVVRRLPFTLNTVITSGNCTQLHDIAQLAVSLGAGGLRFGHLISSSVARADSLQLPPADRRRIDDEIRSWAPSFSIPVVLAPGHYTEDLFPCAPLRGLELNLDCQGNIPWCCQLAPVPGHPGASVIGSLRQSSFTELFARLRYMRRKLRRRKRAQWIAGTLCEADLFPCSYCAAHVAGLHLHLPQETSSGEFACSIQIAHSAPVRR